MMVSREAAKCLVTNETSIRFADAVILNEKEKNSATKARKKDDYAADSRYDTRI